MKKKLLSILLVLCLSLGLMQNVYADAPKEAQTIPAIGSRMYTKTSDSFDFSAVKFESEPAGCTDCFSGLSTMRKIELSSTGTFTDYFTAYCLNGMSKYPQNGSGSWAALEDASALNLAVIKAILESESGLKVISYPENSAKESINFALSYDDKEGGETENSLPLPADITSFAAGNDVTIGIRVIQIQVGSLSSPSIYATYVPSNATTLVKYISDEETPVGSVFNVTVNKNDLETKYDLYNVYDMEHNSVQYNKVLWILEHSFPSMTLENSLEIAGSSKDALLAELTKNGITNASDKIEDYVYSTVQYAIWKAFNSLNETKESITYTLGSEIKNKDQFPELNKLYSYLIVDQGTSVYEKYDTLVYGDKLEITKPAEGKEINKQTEEFTKYGPYYIDTDMISVGNIALSVTTKDASDVSIVDDPGNVISSISAGQPFYIKVLKTNKLSNVAISANVTDAYHFSPTTNRGRIYAPTIAFQQYVASGGKIVKTSKTTSMTLDLNPKTGVEDVAMILLVTLVAFTAGYLVLKFKNRPLEFN